MTVQQPLFDAKATAPPKCRSCGTTRKNLCRWEADREHYPAAAGRRPKSCLNAPAEYDPATAPFPEGY